MAYSEILYDVSERVATVTLNRPDKLNAWTQVMEKEVQEAMLSADRDDNVRMNAREALRSIARGRDLGEDAGAWSRWWQARAR